jgi:hypothetical protein
MMNMFGFGEFTGPRRPAAGTIRMDFVPSGIPREYGPVPAW